MRILCAIMTESSNCNEDSIRPANPKILSLFKKMFANS